MKTKNHWRSILFSVFCCTALLVQGEQAFGHCDTLTGPVVLAAQEALNKGDITPVMKWVKKEQEKEVHEAFKKTLAVRGKGADIKELADMYFYETLVRLHRTGEGAPYTGLKQEKPEPAITMADEALQKGSAVVLEKMLAKQVFDGLSYRFNAALDKKKRSEQSIEAGRAYVEAYIDFTHYVEGIMRIVQGKGHGEETAEKSHNHDHEQ
jgi:hypothetical protein